MFSKKNRLSAKDIEKIFKDGLFISSTNLSLKYIVSNNGKRFSVTIPKSVSKKAVIRNLLRRRGYSLLLKYLDKFPTGFSGVFIFGRKSVEVFGKRKTALFNPMNNLDKELKDIIGKI